MAAESGCCLSLTEARRKCTEKYSCFQQIEITEHMSLPPCYIGRLKEGINQELSKKLMKFCDDLQGVVVSYDKITLTQKYGSLVDESPFLHFDVKVNYIVFQPEVDSKLVGEVNKFGYDHVGCLVHGCFNASIAKPRIHNGYDIYSLSLGSKFKFRVVGLESLNGVLLISGVFDDKSLRTSITKTKSADDVSLVSDSVLEETTSRTHEQKSKKHKINKTEETVPRKTKKDVNGNQSSSETSNTTDSQYHSETLKLVRKKSKKRKKIYTM